MRTLRSEFESIPLALERRLLLSYLGAFAAVFLAAAIVVRFAFVGVIEEQTAARLQDVARAGLRSVLFTADGLAIDKTEISNKDLLTRDQGLQWFDRRGRLLAAEGLTSTARSKTSFDIVSTPILNRRTLQRVGTVSASEWNRQKRADIRYLDTGLLVGTLLALLGSAAGGLALARSAVRPVEQGFRTLREFTDNASHELRGPLTVIATSADAALRDAQRDPEHDRARFATIADGAKQMSRLTSDLLLLAGADRSLERELYVVDLAATVQKIAQQLRPRFAEAGVAFDAGDQEPAIVYGNPDQIERIVANLLENALRYTPRGGHVSVVIGRAGSEIQVSVADTGIGIAAADAERVFDRFWRADPVRSPSGSGLGLSIARALARRHGGDVTLTRGRTTGSTFTASFPIRPHSQLLRSQS